MAGLAFSADGELLAAVGSRGVVKLWHPGTGRELREIQGHAESDLPKELRDRLPTIAAVAVAPDGKTIATGGGDGAVRLWDADTGAEVIAGLGHRDAVVALGWSPDGKSLLSGGRDGALYIWDPASGKPIHRLTGESGREVHAAAWLDGSRVAWTVDYGNRTLRIFDVRAGRDTPVLDLNYGGHALAALPGGKVVAVRDNNAVLHLIDITAGQTLRQVKLEAGTVGAVVASPDGRYVVTDTGYGTRTIHVLDVATGREAYRLTGTEKDPLRVQALAYSPCGRVFVEATWEGTMRLWEAASGKERLQFGKHDDAAHAIAFSPDGRRIATASRDGTVRLWDALSGKEVRRLSGHAGAVARVAFSPDGKRLASGGEDTTILIWEVAPPTPTARVKLSAEEREGLWRDLASDDATAAYRAVARLAASAGTESWLLGQVRAELAPDPAAEKLIRELDDKQFAARDRAARDLEAMGARAEAALHRALAANPTLESRRRLEQLVEKLRAPLLSGARLRALRAVEALEWIATSAAREALVEVAAGPPTSRAAEEARSALRRLQHGK